MMIGIPTVNSAEIVYYILCLLAALAFSIHDIRTRRVPDKGLVLYLCLALLRPAGCVAGVVCGEVPAGACVKVLGNAVCGFAAGLLILLAAALMTGGGAELGGGDIKYCSVLGVIYGIRGLCMVLLVSVLFVLPVLLLCKRKAGEGRLSLPFLPFLFTGCFIETAILILR